MNEIHQNNFLVVLQNLITSYQPQRSWAKVMFLQVSVILSTGGGESASVHAGIPPPPPWEQTPWEQTPPQGADTPPSPRSRHPPDQTPPRSRPPWTRSRHPPPGAEPPRSRHPLGRSWLWHTVNERPVRILLECILVDLKFREKLFLGPSCYGLCQKRGAFWDHNHNCSFQVHLTWNEVW